jgi:DNA-binding beta-propeller fold protein YncE
VLFRIIVDTVRKHPLYPLKHVRIKKLRLQFFRLAGVLAAGFAGMAIYGSDFHPPAGERYPLIGAAGSILPGGRILKPLGTQIGTGPRPVGMAVSQNGTVATADLGIERSAVTIIEPPGKNPWRERTIWARTRHGKLPEVADPDWKGVAQGIVFDSSKAVWVSEGDSGKIRQIDLVSGDTRKTVSLNNAQWSNSFTGDLAWDGAHHSLYIADEANSRLAVMDGKSGRVVSSVRLGRRPSALALAPDGATVYVTSAEANAVCFIDVREPVKPEIKDCVQTQSPEEVVATADSVFVSNTRTDSVTVLSARTYAVTAEIRLQIPSLEQYRGIMPAGMAYDSVTKWLLVAESGINAIGIIDTEKNLLIGHLPVGWMPTRVAIWRDRVYVANALGRGTGPNVRNPELEFGEAPSFQRGSVTTFIMPDESEILRQTGAVFNNDGFVPWMREGPRPPAAIKHVVLIVKEGRTFDEVLGDVAKAGNSDVLSFPQFARFGMHGRAYGGKERFSVQDAQITPNHHAAAHQWAFSDNFHVDGERLPDESFWRKLETGGVTFRKFEKPLPIKAGPISSSPG